MLQNLSIVVSSFDAYEDIWYPFFSQLKKNWPECSELDIFLGTDSKTFQLEGLKINTPLASISKDFSDWSRCIIEILKHVKTDYILFMLDDFFLWDVVDNSRVEYVLDIMKKDKSIGFTICHQEITEDSGPQWRENALTCQYDGLYFLDKGFPYRITTQAGIWRKDYFVKMLRAHETAWQFERRANVRANFNRQKIYGVKDGIFKYPGGGFIWKGRVLDKYLDKFPPELVGEIIKNRGTITKEEWNKPKHRKYGLIDIWKLILSFYPRFW